MLATVPMRCMSMGAGSAVSLSRCMRMPTWRCSRTACWAAPMDFGRPTVTGSTTPGNRTRSRTGMMTSASGGSGGMDAAPRAPASWVPFRSGSPGVLNSTTMRLHLPQGDHQTTVDGGPRDVAVASGREADAAGEAALRQLEAMNLGGAELRRQRADALDDQMRVLDHGLYA